MAVRAARGTHAALRNELGVVNMPSRAIAAVLLRAKAAVGHDELYNLACEYDATMFKSKRHFKHCLKMMKNSERIRIRSVGPQYPGASKLGFVVELTRRGTVAYTRYLGENPPLPSSEETEQGEETAPSLANAIQ